MGTKLFPTFPVALIAAVVFNCGMRLQLLALAFSFFCFGGAWPLFADRADDFVNAQMLEHRIPGIALRVLSNGVAIKTACYGLANLEWKTPVQPETVFEIGSITKQFTAAGILLLAQDGKLSVEDKLSKHLPRCPKAWEQVALRHLLSHTSGIKSYTGLEGFELRRRLTQKQFIERLSAVPLEFEPGASWKYSNSGFSLLGFVIENVSGTNYWSFMRERIFDPLHMEFTTNREPAAVIANRASGYEQTNKIWINRDYDLTDISGAGAIASTLEDLTRWNKSLDTGELLSEATRKQMWTPVHLLDGKATHYGFGWFIEATNGRLNIGHGGSTSGFSSSIQRFPVEHLAVIILSNTDEQIGTTLARSVAKFFF
jgi:CubicO group peptidase (beta-lactamase class C family)